MSTYQTFVFTQKQTKPTNQSNKQNKPPKPNFKVDEPLSILLLSMLRPNSMRDNKLMWRQRLQAYITTSGLCIPGNRTLAFVHTRPALWSPFSPGLGTCCAGRLEPLPLLHLAGEFPLTFTPQPCLHFLSFPKLTVAVLWWAPTPIPTAMENVPFPYL